MSLNFRAVEEITWWKFMLIYLHLSYNVCSQLLLHDSSDLATTLTSWTLWTSYLELKLNAYTQMANACYLLLCILAVIKCKVAICWGRDKLLMQLKDKAQNLSDDGWELINVLPLPLKAWTSTGLYILFESIIVNSFN